MVGVRKRFYSPTAIGGLGMSRAAGLRSPAPSRRPRLPSPREPSEDWEARGRSPACSRRQGPATRAVPVLQLPPPPLME
jgi:hypothetical protein